MDIHKPKAAHSWREFLTEIGTIICGILIALGLEQAVEQVHWRHKVEEAEKSMRIELAEDDGPQAYARLAAVACFDSQLATLQAEVSRGMDRQAFRKAAINYSPPARTWDQLAWQSAVSADIGGHIGAEALQKWASSYAVIAGMQLGADEELKNRNLLPGFRAAPGRMSDAETDRAMQVLSILRGANIQLAGSSLALIQFMRKAGIVIRSETRTDIVRQARDVYGGCARDPETPQPSAPRLDDTKQYQASGALREALGLPPLT